MNPLLGWIVFLAITYLALTVLYISLSFAANAKRSRDLSQISVALGVIQVIIGIALAILAVIATSWVPA